MDSLLASLGSRILSDTELQAVLNAIQSGSQPNIDLFSHSADFHALEDLGLAKLQGEPSSIFQVTPSG